MAAISSLPQCVKYTQFCSDVWNCCWFKWKKVVLVHKRNPISHIHGWASSKYDLYSTSSHQPCIKDLGSSSEGSKNTKCLRFSQNMLYHLITHWGRVTYISISKQGHHYTPRLQRSWKVGILVSPRSSVRMSICGQNRVSSVSSTVFIRSISYLHILSSNFRGYVACKACFKILKISNFGKFFKFVTLTLSSFDLSNMTQ